jgi:hypothetical protein
MNITVFSYEDVYCGEYLPISREKIHCRRLWAFLEEMEVTLFSKSWRISTKPHGVTSWITLILNKYPVIIFFPLFLVKVKGYLMICLSKHTGSLGARNVWVVSTTLPPLCQWERNGTRCTWGWMARRAQEMSLPAGLDARTVQDAACRYTDCAIPGA